MKSDAAGAITSPRDAPHPPPARWYAGLRRRLLGWYGGRARDLPWRAPPGAPAPDAYRVWLSEIMLQQTTVAAVVPYYLRFLERWPAVEALAAAPLDDVLHAWQGLGYYSRARNLHRCAGIVVAAHGGAFPGTPAELAKLPGIGPYTAAAIAAIAFGVPGVAVDGNVERVVARLFAVTQPMPAAKPALRRLAAGFAARRRAGDVVQALMELGATVCLPRRPTCFLCPWRDDCAGRAGGIAEDLPRRTAARARPHRRAMAFVAIRADGAVLLRRRPEEGLLGGLMEVPSSPWDGSAVTRAAMLACAPVAAEWEVLPGLVRHGFTHFDIDFEVVAARLDDRQAAALAGVWCRPADFASRALSTLMKKVLRHAATAGAIAETPSATGR